jgi:hypothetical protein
MNDNSIHHSLFCLWTTTAWHLSISVSLERCAGITNVLTCQTVAP